MGESTDDNQEDPRAAWRALVEHGERYEDFGLGPHSRKMRDGGPMPPSDRDAPLIVDTDIGGDPDDAVALAVAALRVPELALVITSDERRGDRARFARCFLDALGRDDVPVIAGRDLGNARYFCVDGIIPPDVPAQPTDVVGAVDAVCAGSEGKVRWVGMGPLSNLSAVLAARPGLSDRLAVTQMGGALRYRDPNRAEHNFRLDPDAAATMLRSVRRPWLVTSDVTFTSELEISARSPFYQRLVNSHRSRWAGMLKAHLDRWFEQFYPGSIQHDALTLSAAQELPFVDFDLDRVSLDAAGRMRRSEDGAEAFLSRAADYPAFMRWLMAQLGFRDGAGHVRARA